MQESGETMQKAGLKAIDTVIESTAVLIKSKHPLNQRLVELIASRISGVIGMYLFYSSVFLSYDANLDVSFAPVLQQ